MNKRSIILISFAVILAGVYLFYATSLFTPNKIRIISMLRADTPRRNGKPRPPNPLFPGSIPVVFSLDRAHQLTSIKVFSTDDLQFSSSSAAPLWSLVPEDPAKPAKVERFRYGDRIQGMKPADETNPKPQPLQPDVVYRMIVEDGHATGQTDFKTKAP